MNLGAVAVVVYLVALLWVGVRGRKLARSGDMFNIFGRQAKLLRATAGYLSLIGGGELVTISQLGYDNGLSLFWFPGGIAAGFVVLGLYGDRVRSEAKTMGTNTLVGYVTRVFGPTSGSALALVYVIALGALLTIQFIVGSQLIAISTGIPEVATSILMAGVIVSYLLIGGYVAVLSTDVLRLIFLAIVVIVLGGVSISQNGLAHSLTGELYPALPFADGTTLFVLGFFGALCAGDVWQTILASQNKSVMRLSMFLAAAAFLLFGCLIGLLGIAAKQSLPVLPAGTSALVAAMQTAIPHELTPLVALMVVGSVMATADTEIWVLSSSILSLFQPVPRAGEASASFQETTQRRTRITIPIVTMLALGLAYAGRDAEAIYDSLLVLLTSIAPSLLAIFVGVRRPFAIALSLWGGLVAFCGLAAAYKLEIPPELTFGPAACSLVLLLAGVVFVRKKRAVTEPDRDDK